MKKIARSTACLNRALGCCFRLKGCSGRATTSTYYVEPGAPDGGVLTVISDEEDIVASARRVSSSTNNLSANNEDNSQKSSPSTNPANARRRKSERGSVNFFLPVDMAGSESVGVCSSQSQQPSSRSWPQLTSEDERTPEDNGSNEDQNVQQSYRRMTSRSARYTPTHLDASGYHGQDRNSLGCKTSSDIQKRGSFIYKSYSFKRMIGLGTSGTKQRQGTGEDGVDDRHNGTVGSGPSDGNNSRVHLSPYAHMGYNNATNPDSFRHYKPLSFAFLGQIYAKSPEEGKGSSTPATATEMTETAAGCYSEDIIDQNTFVSAPTNPSANRSVVEVVVEHLDS